MRKLRPKRRYCDLAKISELVGGRTKTGTQVPWLLAKSRFYHTPNIITTVVISGVSIVILFKDKV